MKALIAVKGSEDVDSFQRMIPLIDLAGADEVLLAHVIDVEPRADLEHGRERYFTRRPLGPERGGELRRVEDNHARAALQFARHALVECGIPDESIREIAMRGKPKEELRRLADEIHADLIVVFGRPGKPGPHSVGKTARFLLDHAPRAALLVR